MATDNYGVKLNSWHLELAILQSAIDRLSIDLCEDEKHGSTLHVLSFRFHQLVEECPFPPDIK